MPAPHPPEFRQRAVELARQKERPVAQIAKSLAVRAGQSVTVARPVDDGPAVGCRPCRACELGSISAA